jgi:hypothetical protein
MKLAVIALNRVPDLQREKFQTNTNKRINS